MQNTPLTSISIISHLFIDLIHGSVIKLNFVLALYFSRFPFKLCNVEGTGSPEFDKGSSSLFITYRDEIPVMYKT